jgi:large subunit ribosomal protein L10
LEKILPNQRKIDQVNELADLFSNSDTIIMADYKGTSVGDLSGLRRALNNSSAKFKIAKNTLAKLAAEKSSKDALSEEITGPLGFVLSNEDPSQLTKILFQYAEDNDLNFNIKKGLINDDLIDEGTLLKLSKLPSKEILLSKLMGSLNSPITNLVFVMQGTVQGFATVLQRHVENSSVEAEAPAEEPVEAEAPAEEPVEAEAPAEEPVEAEAPAEEPVEAEAPAEEPVEAEAPAEEPAEEDKK